MGSPSDARDRYFSTYDWSGLRVQWEIITSRDVRTATLLDVGAGWGKYRDLLPDYTMDAVEIWPEYVEQENLRERYRDVIVGDICDVELRWYDVVIMGDVFEHLTVEQATELLPRLVAACDELYVAVPFEYPQGMEHGNPYEIHQQPDLNEQTMSWRYREWLRPLYVESDKAIYVKQRETP